jgi:hypothetical protein
MALSQEFSDFVANWLVKADAITLGSLNTYFDKFFTLYVVYNRLYAEATFALIRNGQVDISRKKSFPDREAATNYVVQFIGSTNLVTTVTSNADCAEALNQIEGLIERNDFSIKLHMITGDRQRQKDEDLLRRLRNSAHNTKAEAILDLVYSVRCNTFHGHKGFEGVQVQILGPVIVLLKTTIELIREKLANQNPQWVPRG